LYYNKCKNIEFNDKKLAHKESGSLITGKPREDIEQIVDRLEKFVLEVK